MVSRQVERVAPEQDPVLGERPLQGRGQTVGQHVLRDRPGRARSQRCGEPDPRVRGRAGACGRRRASTAALRRRRRIPWSSRAPPRSPRSRRRADSARAAAQGCVPPRPRSTPRAGGRASSAAVAPPCPRGVVSCGPGVVCAAVSARPSPARPTKAAATGRRAPEDPARGVPGGHGEHGQEHALGPPRRRGRRRRPTPPAGPARDHTHRVRNVSSLAFGRRTRPADLIPVDPAPLAPRPVPDPTDTPASGRTSEARAHRNG